MNFDIKCLVRERILKMIPYQSARRLGGHGNIWLNANELPISTELKLKHHNLNRYPDFQPCDVIVKYADYVNCQTDQILVLRGADEGIELLIRAFCEPGLDAIISCPPTYDMYGICAEIFGVKNKQCNTKTNWNLNLLQILSNLNQVKLIYICNPNNPTGNIIDISDIKYLLKMTLNKALVVIDEAYIEFSNQYTAVSLLSIFPNIVILRTLSKAFGLAGLRCGFIIAHPEVIKVLSKILAPYPLSSPVIEIASIALQKNNIQLMKNRVLELIENKNWLSHELKKIKIIEHVFKSFANYILVKFFYPELVFNFLIKKGIVLRNQNTKLYLSGCIRISIGTRFECLELLKSLKELSYMEIDKYDKS
ncbi:Histidinol-phosphate aminotransferase [Buchnera aphidicola (Eriosoma grossulariae)]|uniref:histidinol-phosphate transaminase n=1 Tax=Buchnera aphidicola TaxID=9 RepID=UPI00346492F0